MTDLRGELTRSMSALAAAEPGTEAHSRLVASVDTLMRLLWAGQEPGMTADTPNITEATTWEPGGGEAVEPEPAPKDSDTPPWEEPAAGLTKDEVKAKLLALSGKCDALDIAAVMEGIGYHKLSDIPASRYEELLANAEAAVKELEEMVI